MNAYRAAAPSQRTRWFFIDGARHPRFRNITFEPGQLCLQLRHRPSALPQHRKMAAPGSPYPVLERFSRHAQTPRGLRNRHLLFQDQLYHLLPEFLLEF